MAKKQAPKPIEKVLFVHPDEDAKDKLLFNTPETVERWAARGYAPQKSERSSGGGSGGSSGSGSGSSGGDDQ